MARAFNADGLLPGEVDYRNLESKITEQDAISRKNWATATAYMLLNCFPPSVANKIARGGFAKFLSIAEPVLRNQDLKTDDFRHIYDTICAIVAKRRSRHGKAH